MKGLSPCGPMLKASGIKAPDFNPGEHDRKTTWRPERTLKPVLGIDRFLAASFQDAFRSIAGNPGLESGAVMPDAFSIGLIWACPLRAGLFVR